MSKTASEISRGTEVGQAWADVMGMSIEEVATLMEEDAYGALIKMVEGLENVDESGGNLDQTLRDLNINEIRQLDVMKRLVGSSGDLAEAQKMANGEWEENNALVEESAARYETLESKMQIIKNSIDNIFSNMGNAFAQSSEGILSKITEIIQEVDRMTDSFFDAEGNITETGEAFVDVATKIAGITTVLGLAGAAFMAFGTGGAVAVAVTAGLGAIGLAVTDLLDQFGLIPESLGGDDVESAIRLIERSSDEATAEAATNYVRLKDEALQALGDLATESGEEAAKSREKIVEQFELMSQEVVEAIEGDRQALNTAIAGLMEGATEPEREALEKARANIEKHYDEQLKLAQNYTETVADVMNNHITETGAITDEGMQKFRAAAQGMDQLFGTAIAKSQGEMSKFKSAFDRAFDERDVKKAQENLTGMANSTVDSITELNKAYEEQKNAIEATDAPLKDKELILQGLEKQYDESRLALLDNLAAMESEAKQNGLNVSAIEDLSDAQLEKLGITRDEYAQLLLTSGALKDNADENHNLSTALDAAKDAASRSSEEYAKLVEEFNKFDIGASTVKEALSEIRNVTEEEALEIGKLFAVNLADGTQEVDMGTYGTMTVEDFVQGVRSEDITSKEAGIALSNAFRDGLGQEPLTETGQKQVEEYVAGMSSGEATVEEVAKMLGYATADGVQVNLEGEAAMNIETFVAGLKKGEFGVFEVIRIMTDNMEGILTKDFSQFGEEDMATFAAGLESGLISTEAATELITNSLDENMLVDLGPQGEQSVGSWIDMFTNGDIKVQEFVSGLEAFLGEETYFDLSEPGTSTAESYATAFGTGMDATTQVMMDYGPKLKESAKVDLSEEGGNVAGSFANGIAGRMEEIRQKASEVKSTTENTVGSTTDGGGGQKAASDFMLGFINLAPSIASWVTGTKTDTESTLGSTTDGGGGASAIGAFASGLLTNSGTAETNASSVSTSVENALSNTSDGSGGLNATGAFASGILANLVQAQSAANNASGAVQNALSTTTDGGGGANAGAAFSSGVLGSIATATGAANSAKLGVQGTLGTTTDGGGGLRAGSIFSGGLASTIGAVTGSANSAKNSVQTTLGSTTDSSGGQKAGSMFAGGIRSQFGAVQSAANTNKTNVERTLGSTTDNRGGNRAGTMFVSGIRSQIGAATSAANSNKSNVESALGSTTDDGGGNRAGNMFVSGVKSHTGAASGAGNQVSSSARSGLSNNSNTFSLGADFGSGFVRGISSYVGAAARAAANLVASALSAIKRRQNSASPSKETMKLGDDFGDGFALAIVDKTREAVSAARNMARDAINAAGDESVKNSLAVDVGGFNGSLNAVNSRVTHELEATSRDRALAQPMQLTTVIGGQEFETFSDNIYAQNTKSANFKDSYRG